jgi:hypothetical protein
MRPWAFWLGITMIAYDLLGHACCLLARLTGPTGALLWNTYSRYVWPSLAQSVAYDAYWTTFFALAIVLLVLGRHRC